MGVNKYAMPLLSTLAALVIIVHTAEENFEQDYRELRPRSFDVGEPYTEKPWRNTHVSPVLTPTPLISQDEMWDENNPDQHLRRRRPGRKRKRRPLTAKEDESFSQEAYIYKDQSNRPENNDTPRRRRKKNERQESNEFSESRWREDGTERKRRRGQRRKRPNRDKWSELSEFNDYRQHEREQSKETVDTLETRVPDTNYKDYNLNNDDSKIIQAELIPHIIESELSNMSAETIENKFEQEVQNNDHESLSEFSSEIGVDAVQNINSSPSEAKDKIRDKNPSNFKNITKAKEYGPLDPKSLKSILKRSNGKSLSEILQQNNLTLADLLQGNEKALMILKNEDFLSNQEFYKKDMPEPSSERTKNMKRVADKSEYDLREHENVNIETITLIESSTATNEHIRPESKITRRAESALSEEAVGSDGPKSTTKHYLRRRYPIRKPIRLKSMTNNTFKGQLSRDLIAQSALRYKNNRNVSRPREWKEYLPARVKIGQFKPQHHIVNENNIDNITTTTYTSQESTTQEQFETTTDPYFKEDTEFPIIIEMGTEPPNGTTDSIQTTTEVIVELQTEDIEVSEKSIISSVKPIIDTSNLRRQVFNNRLKRKRHRQKVSTTEYPDDTALQQVFGEASFVSASEFIAKTQTKPTTADDDNDFSTLEDFLTTESSQSVRKRIKSQKLPTTNHNISPTTPNIITMEESAKMEIEEILNDSLTNARLTAILKERNMTLGELVAHRERGSSHLHLADIFHNASREPNPPEPFLTKSLIEPISKETYPLRALLEANLHDAKTATLDPNVLNSLNIPVVMDFGNNVNEIGENMGIISLFNNFSKVEGNSVDDNNVINNDVSVTNDVSRNNETVRDGRSFNEVKDSVTWNDLIKLMQTKHEQNIDKTYTTDVPKTFKANIEEETIDDSLLVLEDLENLKHLNNKISTDDLLEINLYERNESPRADVETSTTSNTRSVTVATISIIGLALILFLLTYAALKWKQQSIMFHKKQTTEDECVPTPIFENRKAQKLNSSTRSKSPMLSSNIYTIDSVDHRDGSESPEYMWDSLRKPYQ